MNDGLEGSDKSPATDHDRYENVGRDDSPEEDEGFEEDICDVENSEEPTIVVAVGREVKVF